MSLLSNLLILTIFLAFIIINIIRLCSHQDKILLQFILFTIIMFINMIIIKLIITIIMIMITDIVIISSIIIINVLTIFNFTIDFIHSIELFLYFFIDFIILLFFV